MTTHVEREITSLPLMTARYLVEAIRDSGPFVQLSGVLNRVVKLSKICNDLPGLCPGPRGGRSEINLLKHQADVTIAMATEAGHLQQPHALAAPARSRRNTRRSSDPIW